MIGRPNYPMREQKTQSESTPSLKTTLTAKKLITVVICLLQPNLSHGSIEIKFIIVAVGKKNNGR